MPSEPLIALALSLLISLAPFLPAAEKSAPEEEPARRRGAARPQRGAACRARADARLVVRRAGPAGRAVEAAALRRDPRAALPCLPHRRRLDARAGAAHREHGQRSAALYRRGGCGPGRRRSHSGQQIQPSRERLCAGGPCDGRARLLQRRQAQERGQRRFLRSGRGHVGGNGTAPCQRLALPQLPDAEESLRPLPHTVQ